MAYENLSNVLLDTTIKLRCLYICLWHTANNLRICRKQRDKCIQWCPISKAAALDFEAKLKKLPTVLNSVFQVRSFILHFISYLLLQGSLTSAQIDVTA